MDDIRRSAGLPRHFQLTIIDHEMADLLGFNGH
jgi:hypothetical protein